MQAIRGNEISMIFQEPMTSLNPVHTCGRQIAESVRLHRGLSGHEAFEEAVEMLGASGYLSQSSGPRVSSSAQAACASA